MAGWTGQSKGTILGYKIFVFCLRNLNIHIAYFVLRIVVFYYFLFSNKEGIKQYFSKIKSYRAVKLYWNILKNYNIFGQIVLDRIAILSGMINKFTFTRSGEEYLTQLALEKSGCVLMGFHAGNGDIAGKVLSSIDAKVNIVMYENEKSNLKAYFETVMDDRNMHFIYIKPNDYSYLYEMTEALKNKEFLAIYGDRFVPGTQTVVKKFLGHDAEFALGHLHLACKHRVPVSYVSLVKTGTTTYHLNATKPKLYDYPSNLVGRKEVISSMLDDYINEIERVLNLYPLQWFNYYKFWKDSPKN